MLVAYTLPKRVFVKPYLGKLVVNYSIRVRNNKIYQKET